NDGTGTDELHARTNVIADTVKGRIRAECRMRSWSLQQCSEVFERASVFSSSPSVHRVNRSAPLLEAARSTGNWCRTFRSTDRKEWHSITPETSTWRHVMTAR